MANNSYIFINMNIREILTQGKKKLKTAGIENSGLDASLLLANILNVSRTELTAMGQEQIQNEDCDKFQLAIQRRIEGECTAYIIGKKEFMELEFIVNKSVLVPRPDTETLVEAALKELDNVNFRNSHKICASENTHDKVRILDLCTGCGAIAVSLKHKKPELDIFATDISADALLIAQTNAENLLPSGNKINFYPGDLYDALNKIPYSVSDKTLPAPFFRIIISNPPYIPSSMIKSLPLEVQNEPLIALDGGKDGLALIERIIKGALEHLEKNGSLMLEADPSQMKTITTLFKKSGFNDINIYNDLSGKQRVISGIYE